MHDNNSAKSLRLKYVKHTARKFMRRNFGACILVSIILTFLFGGVFSISENFDMGIRALGNLSEATDSPRLATFVKEVETVSTDIVEATSVGEKSKHGVIAKIYHSTQNAGGSSEMAFLDALNRAIFEGKIPSYFISAGAMLLTFLIYIFFEALLRMGSARFYLETRLYPETHIGRILFVYRMKRIRRCAGVAARRVVFTGLWGLTLVMLPVKYYSYSLVPYIAAENPDVTGKTALKLSSNMMRGYKWRMFLLDLSFVPWYLLSVLTFGLLTYLYIGPYAASSRAEMYMRLRTRALAAALPGSELLNDVWLAKRPPAELLEGLDIDPERYPTPLSTPEEDERRWLNSDYEVSYRFVNIILMFFIFSFIGWVWECGQEIIKHGEFVNRGSLYGPWIPIYGAGGCLVILLFRRLAKHPVVTFFATMIVCGALEFGTSWVMEEFSGVRYWDYSGYFFNIQGRICLEGLLVFAVAGTAAIYAIGPTTNEVLERIPLRARRWLCVVLATLFGADLAYTSVHPHVGDHITYGD
jgi:uncharacterized membrane protein